MEQGVRKVEGGSTFNYTREDDPIDAAVLSDGAASYIQAGDGIVSETRGTTTSYYHVAGPDPRWVQLVHLLRERSGEWGGPVTERTEFMRPIGRLGKVGGNGEPG
ncbi:MAG: hypothetical protein SFU56_04120 [Capsulimonadales bacterium]|nr:hypothetical protein [Capsulimonadales bacterium]